MNEYYLISALLVAFATGSLAAWAVGKLRDWRPSRRDEIMRRIEEADRGQ
jgi:hypothetical protein